MPLFDSTGQALGIIVALYHEAISETSTAESLLKIFASRAAAELERIDYEEELSRSEEKYRTLFEESRDAVFMATVEGRFEDINETGVEMLGYESRDELLQLDLARDVYADAADRERYQRDLAENGYVKDYELKLKRKDGEVRTFSVSSILVRDKDGNVTGNWGIGRDITEHRRLEEQLVHAQKMESIGRLAGGIAHDFNNFLTAVQGYIEMAIADLPLNSPVKPELVEAARSADRAVDVTRQLLLFSRHGKMDMKPMNLNTTIQGMLGMLDRLIGEQYPIITNLDEDLELVKADAGNIEQVLLNLAVNARDAMPEGGEIVVGTQNLDVGEPVIDIAGGQHFGEFVCLWVKDQGEGMDEETQAKIFEPFFSTKSVGTGTGLGLSVVYGIVEQHGGWVEVESQFGIGSTFRVFLPVTTETPTERRQVQAPGDLRGKGERVLLVEDEDIVRDLGVKMLTQNGYTVDAAADAEGAIELFERSGGDYQLLFSDVVLPGINGVGLADELRRRRPELLVLLASGYTGDVVDQQELVDKGYSFVEKPYSLPDILLELKKLLQSGE
jgi:PAS domain S-box-containing protein